MIRPRGAAQKPRACEAILVVEDSIAIRKVIVRILRPLGYQILEASRASEAQRISSQHDTPIDLLLTDVAMPGTTGPALAAELRKTRPEMEILFMSGYSRSTMERNVALDANAHFLEKPFAPDALIRKVGDLLGGVPAAPSRPPSRRPPTA